MRKSFPGKEELSETYQRVQSYIHRTPVMTSQLINEKAGAELFFKCDIFQKMGAFKMRGAMNAVLNLSQEQLLKGVATHSSGNFAQALSLAARNAGIKAYIVMPENAPEVKKSAVRDYGGKIILSGNTPKAREDKADEVCAKTGATFIHPSNNMDVILGNSTATFELIQDTEGLDVIMAPVGGGGLIAGTALAAHYFSPSSEVIGAEPSGADDAFRSLRDGVIYPSENPQTICDGLRTFLGDLNFPIIQTLLKEIILVHDKDTKSAMKLIMERMKLVIEPSAAITLAAILLHPDKFKNKRIGIILCGGNVDLSIVSGLVGEV